MDNTLSVKRESNEIITPTQEPTVILGEPQRLALEWLMGGGSVTEASQYAGVCRQTVSEWLHHDVDFRRVYFKWRDQLQMLNQARLTALSESALDNIAAAIRETRDVKVSLVVLKSMGVLGNGK